MSIRRIVPNIKSSHMDDSRQFYVDFLGLEVAMDMGFIVTFVSRANPTAQISVIQGGDDSGGAAPHPDLSLEVDDIDTCHAEAVKRGVEIVYPLTSEPWGVRRFFVRDPNGAVLNIMSHG